VEALSSLLPFLFLSTGAIAVWVLRPIHRAARSRRAPAQLALIDFLCLIFLAQLPMAVIGWFGGTFNPRGTWVLYVFGWVACGLLWWVAVRLLSRAGVRQARRRAVFQVFVLPDSRARADGRAPGAGGQRIDGQGGRLAPCRGRGGRPRPVRRADRRRAVLPVGGGGGTGK